MILREYREEISGVSWSIIEKFARITLGVVITGIVARHVGTEGFGILMNAYSCLGLAMLFTSFGLRRAQPRLLGEETEYDARSVTIGSSNVLMILLSLGALVFLNLFFIKAQPSERSVIFIMSLILLSVPFATTVSSALVVSSRQNSIAKSALLALLIGGTVRAFFALNAKSLPWIALSFTLEIYLIFFFQLISYFRHLKEWPSPLRVNTQKIIGTARSGLPVMLAGLAAFAYHQLDVIMLRNITGANEAGLYSAATRLASIPLLLPSMLLNSFTGRLMRGRKKNENRHFDQKDIRNLSRLCLAGAIAVLPLLYLFGPYIMSLVYGEGFSASISFFTILVLSTPLVFWGSLRNHMLILSGRGRLLNIAVGSGALCNLVLNIWLIPIYGGVGAAWATVISYALTNIGINFCIKDLRQYNKMAFTAFKPQKS